MMSLPACEIGVVNARDHVGAHQHQQVVVAAQVARVRLEAFAAEVGLGQLVALNHRAHRAVEHENPPGQQRRRARRYVFFVDSSCLGGMWFRSRCNQHRERIAGLACADADLDVAQPGVRQQPRQLVVAEAEAAIAELGAHPLFAVRAEIEHEHAAAGLRDARGFGHRASRIVRVMQRLRQQGDVDRLVLDRQLVELAAFPDDVRDAAPAGKPSGAVEHDRRSIDGNHPRCPARRFDRQIAFTAPEVGDLERRQQQTERARPRRPAPAGHELTGVARIGAAVGVEVLLAQPQHFLQPRLVRADDRIGRRVLELSLEHRPQRVVAIGAQGGRKGVVGEAGVLLLDNQAGIFQQAEMARHAGLREAEDAGQLRDVQPLARQHPQQPEPGLVAEQPVERRRRPSHH